MKISFSASGDNNTLENRGLGVADTDTQIPIGKQFGKESEVTVKGPVKYIAITVAVIIFLVIAFMVVKIIIR